MRPECVGFVLRTAVAHCQRDSWRLSRARPLQVLRYCHKTSAKFTDRAFIGISCFCLSSRALLSEPWGVTKSQNAGRPLPGNRPGQGFWAFSRTGTCLPSLTELLPVTRPLWAPYLACPCPLAFCDLDNKAMLEHAVVSTLLSLYAASPGLATAKPCVLCMAVARGCAARACGPVVKF